MQVAKVIDDPNKGSLVRYEGDRPRRWASHKDIYAQGYWRHNWSSNITRLEEIDMENRLLTPAVRNWSKYGVKADQRFFYFHILEELGEPGEWYLDFTTGILYFWPPDDGHGEAIVSMLESPMIELTDVSHVRFERLILEGMRGNAFEIRDGHHVTVAGCEMRNVGKDAARIIRGFDHAFVSCDIHHTGECGIRIESGDRLTLEPCRHRVHNCHFHHIARTGWTYFGAVWLEHASEFGCGTIVSHNRMHEHRHAFMSYKGNDHLIEFNEFYNWMLEGDDGGAIFTGRNTDMQGNVVRYNHFHHAGDSGRLADWGTFGVYMDDGSGGTDVYGNIFHYIDKAIVATGGINIKIHDNIFVDCRPAIRFDERGACAGADGENSMFHGFIKKGFYAVHADGPAYRKYPHMDKAHEAFQKHLGLLAWGCEIVRNIAVGSGGDWFAGPWNTIPDRIKFASNLQDCDTHFADPAFGIFDLQEDSPVYAESGFVRRPMEPIGLVRDEYRTVIEDVRCAIEVLRPMAADGTPGRGRLICRNVGDVDVSGTELIEFKTARHGIGVAYVEVPYHVPAGTTGSYAFDITVPPEHLDDLYELYIFSRGEEHLRPAWTVMPLAYSLETDLDLVTPFVAGRYPEAGSVRCSVRNVEAGVVSRQITVTAAPADAAVVAAGGDLCVELAPGARLEQSFPVTLQPGFNRHAVSRVVLTTHGKGVKPAQMTAIVEYPLPELGDIGVAQVKAALQEEPLLPVCGLPGKDPASSYRGAVRLGLANDALALYVTTPDGPPSLGALVWHGSCIEVFGCSLERERIGHVFNGIEVGHVCLVPACKDTPARGGRLVHVGHHWEEEIEVSSSDTGEGYELTAIIPFKFLALSTGIAEFLFEIQISTGSNEASSARHACLFNSTTAFNDTTQYAMATRRTILSKSSQARRRRQITAVPGVHPAVSPRSDPVDSSG